MITDEEVQRQIRERTRMLLTPSDKQDQPIEHGLDRVDESGLYQVYEVTLQKGNISEKTILDEGLPRQRARNLVREYRNALTGDDIITKGYGFEKMPTE